MDKIERWHTLLSSEKNTVSRSDFPQHKFVSILCFLPFVVTSALVAPKKEQTKSEQMLTELPARCCLDVRITQPSVLPWWLSW